MVNRFDWLGRAWGLPLFGPEVRVKAADCKTTTRLPMQYIPAGARLSAPINCERVT
jgi:hypothetical protein